MLATRTVRSWSIFDAPHANETLSDTLLDSLLLAAAAVTAALKTASSALREKTRPEGNGGVESLDYEDVAQKLIVYSRSLAKGSLSTMGGASMGEPPVLQYLLSAKADVAPSDIAGHLRLSRARVSHILDSLESKGYIERNIDPADRRRVIVTITDSGREHAEQRNSESVSALAKQLSALGERDAAELVRILNKAYSITYDKDNYLP